MNLIEQLGGYDKAKRAIENDVLKDHAPYTYETAQRELLEYRRIHNKYECGDYVVLNVGSRVYKIDHIYKKEVWLDSAKESLDIVNIDDISRHATNEEIEVQKILEKKNGFG